MKRFKKHLIQAAALAVLTIAGTMTLPRPANAATSSPVQLVPNTRYASTVSGGSGQPSILKVPTAHHLVIETLSVSVDVTPSDGKIGASVTYISGGKTVTLFVPLTYAYTTPSNDFATYVAIQEVRLYPDLGSKVTLSTVTPTGSAGTTFLTVSGYLY